MRFQNKFVRVIRAYIFVYTMSEKDMSDLFTEITGETSVTENQDEASMGTRLRDDESDGRSTATTVCPKCGHDKAYYEMKQIRSADESETRFFECVDCNYKWRENDH